MKRKTSVLIAIAMIMSVFPTVSQAGYDSEDRSELSKITYNYDGDDHTRYMEKLDRGLIAVRTSEGIFLSWRLLGNEASVKNIVNASGFRIYKNGVRIATVNDSTNYLDRSGGISDLYSVAIDGGTECEAVRPKENSYFDIALDKPAAFSYTSGDNDFSYNYTVGDVSCGDLDGDGQYELVIKWDSNPQDNSNGGITGKVLLDAYKLDGTRLWDKPIDLGRNIRAGAHYTQFLVYDFDGDGRAEITCKTAPGSKGGDGGYVTAVSAESSIRAADNTKEYANTSGYILEGPEYFTVFSGETGAAIDTINYPVQRVSASVWGDAYGNRCDRFVADVSYLDGVRPYAVYWRGYYFGQSGYSARCGVFAASFDGERLSVPVEHIFDTRSDQPGYTAGNERYVGEGNHNMTSGDFDDDGRDEVTAGALALEFDDSGKLVPMWCTYKEHGDAIHIGDYDPTHKGLELFVVHEDGGGTNSYGGVYNDFGCSVIDPATGEIMWHTSASKDTGRGLMANVGAGGYYQVSASSGVGGYYSLGGGNFQKGATIGYNFRVFWDADLYDEALDGTTVSAWDGRAMAPVFTADGCISINGTKSNPALQADLFGDWREELVYPTSDNSRLRIFTTTDVTEYKLPTLMHDPVYRSGVASEQSAYNQPPHIGFYLADEIFRAAVDRIEITKAPDKTVYFVGEDLNTAGLKVIAHFTDGSTDDVSDYAMVSGYDSAAAGEQSVTVTYSRTTAEFKVYVDAGFTVDDDNYITGYTLGGESAIIPDTISGQPVKGIRSGALVSSGLKEITINAEELDIEPGAFPDDITIDCMLGSEVYIYAVNNGISYRTIDTRDFISDITYSESEYSGFDFRMGTSAKTQSVGHITYGVGSRRRDGDSTTGYYIGGGDEKYLLGTVGRFSTRGRNLYFIINDMPLATDTVDNVFESDIMFSYGDGTEAMLMVSDSSGNAVDFVSREYSGIENDVWYTYKLVYHSGSYYRSLVPKGEAAEFEYIGTSTSESGVSRIDIIPSNYLDWTNDLGKSQSASISFDNTRVYTNVEISELKLTVDDGEENSLPYANITINGEAYKADGSGEFAASLLSGLYDISVSADGYVPTTFMIPAFKNRIEKAVSLELIRVPIEGVSFENAEYSLKKGHIKQAKLIEEPYNAADTEFIYSSSDEGVVSISAEGMICALKAGVAEITAVSSDDPSISCKSNVTVYDQYASVLSSIEIEGPETAYIPNNTVPNKVQFKARCYDQNGVEMSSSGLRWGVTVGLTINSDGVLTIPGGKTPSTYTVRASSGSIRSNDIKIQLTEYPEASDIIARETCTGSLGIYQETEVKSVVLGDITYNVGARSPSGDKYTGFTIDTFDGHRCLFAKAGQFGSAGREAYMVFDKISELSGYDVTKDYVFETDLYFTGTEKMIFEDNAGADIMQLEAGLAGLNTNTWYHYMLIYSDGSYSQYVTDADGNHVNTTIPTLQSAGVISQIRFVKGDTNYETIYLKGLKYFETENAFSKITVKVRDMTGASVPGAAVNVMDDIYSTDARGNAKLILPLGAYNVTVSDGENECIINVMSLGENKSYTIVLGKPETGILNVDGDKMTVNSDTDKLMLFAVKYNNGLPGQIYATETDPGEAVYSAGFVPDRVFLWNADQKPLDSWTK